jgi:hypothetical protein
MTDRALHKILRDLRAELAKLNWKIAATERLEEHVSDDALENYHLGKVAEGSELAPLEEHLLGCPYCAERAEKTAQYVDALRAALISAGIDLD